MINGVGGLIQHRGLPQDPHRPAESAPWRRTRVDTLLLSGASSSSKELLRNNCQLASPVWRFEKATKGLLPVVAC